MELLCTPAQICSEGWSASSFAEDVQKRARAQGAACCVSTALWASPCYYYCCIDVRLIDTEACVV